MKSVKFSEYLDVRKLLRAYAAEQDLEKKAELRYQLMLLDADFKPVFEEVKHGE